MAINRLNRVQVTYMKTYQKRVGRFTKQVTELVTEDKAVSAYDINDWNFIIAQDRIDSEDIQLYKYWNGKRSVTSPDYYEDQDTYYQAEAFFRQQEYEKQLAELDRLEKKNLATQKELLEMEERRQKLIELSKAGLRASKFGTGSGGSPVSTLLQEIATNKGNLLS